MNLSNLPLSHNVIDATWRHVSHSVTIPPSSSLAAVPFVSDWIPVMANLAAIACALALTCALFGLAMESRARRRDIRRRMGE